MTTTTTTTDNNDNDDDDAAATFAERNVELRTPMYVAGVRKTAQSVQSTFDLCCVHRVLSAVSICLAGGMRLCGRGKEQGEIQMACMTLRMTKLLRNFLSSNWAQRPHSPADLLAAVGLFICERGHVDRRSLDLSVARNSDRNVR